MLLRTIKDNTAICVDVKDFQHARRCGVFNSEREEAFKNMEKIGESPMRELREIKSGISESEWIKGSREDYSHTWNQHHYQLIIENAHEAIFVAQDDRMKFVNPKTEEMSGYSRSELLTMDRMLLTHPEDREMVSEGFKRMIAGENMSRIYHHRIMDKEGNVKWVELNAVLILWEGRPATLNFVSDITEKKQAEEDLKTKSRNLEETNTALKVLLTHRENDQEEIEQKLLSNIKELVIPYVERLATTSLDAQQEAYLDIIRAHLNEVLSPFLVTMKARYSKFTPREIEVADLIRNGKTSREIAVLLHVTPSAVHLHRHHIRNKLGLKHRKVNLQSFLASLS